MYVHLSSPFLQAVSLHLFYLGRVPFFLVLAGYFLGRNITWNKAFNRAFWLFIPFLSGGDCVRLCRGRVPDPAQPPAQGPQP